MNLYPESELKFDHLSCLTLNFLHQCIEVPFCTPAFHCKETLFSHRCLLKFYLVVAVRQWLFAVNYVLQKQHFRDRIF